MEQPDTGSPKEESLRDVVDSIGQDIRELNNCLRELIERGAKSEEMGKTESPMYGNIVDELLEKLDASRNTVRTMKTQVVDCLARKIL